jgi:two-component system osmolarity sensor histidine kinase EnvZ
MRNKGDADLINSMQNDLESMKQLINQTLELAISPEDAMSKLVPIELNELIQSEIDNIEQEKNSIEWKPQRPCTALISKTALQRVLQNLLQNALRYGNNKPIKIELNSDSKYIHICISDQGSGIPVENHKDIFQPFFRLETSRNINTGGSGLGLAIVSQLCDIYGWHIQLKSSTPKGSIFCLRINKN